MRPVTPHGRAARREQKGNLGKVTQKEGNQKHMGGRKIQKEKTMEMQSKKSNTLKSHRMNTLAYSIKSKARVKYETTHSKNIP